ncbi:putative pyoverdine/dityrosine biosynthesis protein [Dactylonectria macrodidyma]|uniref:Pyoverdine/dityrosine biosynthesis protein n=1 Tax=Dactylonectria macrodidyma TaxID=307937 RepID=A0A9P9CY17_9HYPO|nr:putative pyoverdine/dityrosine biosynthesis protein [Dactylonectria macrodidyma]
MTSLPIALNASALQTSSTILQIIDRYRMVSSPSIDNRADESALKFIALTYTHVKAGRPVPLCLPAFPFKSPNSVSKVLGNLPDKAEEFSLARLNGLCQAIGDVYTPGAKLTIISDGLVYNDLLGVPDKDVWAYGKILRELAITKGFKHISFSRLRDLVNIELPTEFNEMTYVANASNFRRALLNSFSRPDWSWEEARQSEDVCMTYRGYIKFLQLDLENVYPLKEDRTKSKYKQGIEYIAKQMIVRGDAFANAVRAKYIDHIRLSIHPSTGASKLSLNLLPTDTFYTTPWHFTIVFRLDGTTTTGPRAEFEKDDMLELIYENGHPSYYREKSDLLSWAEEKGGITCEPIYPAGLTIRPAKGHGALTMHDIDPKKVRALSEINSPIILRGFVKRPEKQAFIKKSYEFGEPLPWKFGLLLEVKDRGADTRGLNNVLSAEWMPFHYDGLFKTIKKVDEATNEEVLVPTPPQFQFFHAPTASPSDTGFTLFSSSTLLFKYLPSWLTVEKLSTMTWSVSTSSFDSTTLKGLPLVIKHPTTGVPCIRYHEPWPQSKTSFDATSVTIDDNDDSEMICDAITALLHDRRVAFYHAWEKGDLLVSDNVLMMHTRSDFTAGSDRELWRIHFD